MKAFLKNYRQSPRKVRLIAGLIKGKLAERAVSELSFLPNRAVMPIQKLLKSAIANAENNDGVKKEELYIKDIRVDKGVVLKRWMPRAFGMAKRINKRNSHILIVLGEKKPVEVKKVKRLSNLNTTNKKRIPRID